MKLNDVNVRNAFIHRTLVYLAYIMLGILFVLAFYFISKKDRFLLHDDNINIKINGTYKIDAFASYGNDKLKWEVIDKKVVTVDKDGVISAHNSGETTIYVYSRFHLYKKKINVRVSNFTVYSIIFEDDEIEIEPKETGQLVPILNNDRTVKSNLDWKSSDNNVVKVVDNGRITAYQAGNAIITATDKYTGLSASINVKVNGEVIPEDEIDSEEATDEDEVDTIPIESISLNTNNLDMYIGDVRKISPTIVPLNATDKNLVYASTDNSIAKVDSNGLITALKQGLCNINVASPDGSVQVSMMLRVIGNRVSVSSFKLQEEELNLDTNESYILTPVISPANATNQEVSYSSSNSKVAEVDENGKIKALKEGVSTIVAVSSDSHQSSSIIVNVSKNKVIPKEIADSYLKNYKPVMLVGQTVQLDASVTSINKDNIRINYTTSNTDIVSIDQNGLITALSPGIATIDLETSDGSYHVTNLLTVLPGEISPELVYISKTNLQLVKNASYDLIATVIPTSATLHNIEWSSSNPAVASVNNSGKVTGHGIGSAIITAKVSSTSISRSVRVAVVNNESLIDVRKQQLTPYYRNFKIYDAGTINNRAMQNFAIANIGKSNEVIYTSLVTNSNIKRSTKVTSKLKKDTMRTIIVKIPKSEISKPSSSKRTYMYLNNSGHGQTFDLDLNTNYIWTNGNGYVAKDSSGVSWGRHKSLVQVKFKRNNKSSSYKPTRMIKIKNNGIDYLNPEITFNWNENLAVVRSNRDVFIYNATDFRKGKLTLLYNFTLQNKSSDGKNYSRQGEVVSNGYYYQYRGYLGTKLYIEVYNFAGELQYTYIFNPKLKSQEAEGMKIYNNMLFIGITSKCSGCSGRVNSIYYFK